MKKARIWDARQLPAFLTPKEYGALMNIDPKTVQTMTRRRCRRCAARGCCPPTRKGRGCGASTRMPRWRGRESSKKKGPPVLEHRRALG